MATCSVSRSVMPVPSRSDGVTLISSAYRLIWWAAPWTSATRMLRLRKQRDVEQQVGEVVVLDDRAVDGDDEHPVAEPGHVAQDFAEVGEAFVHRGGVRWSVVIGRHVGRWFANAAADRDTARSCI